MDRPEDNKFPDHWSLEQVEKGVADGSVVKVTDYCLLVSPCPYVRINCKFENYVCTTDNCYSTDWEDKQI